MDDSRTRTLCTRIDDQNVAMVGIVMEGELFETKKCTDQFRGCATIEPLDGLVVERALLTFGVEIEKRDRFIAVQCCLQDGNVGTVGIFVCSR